MDVSTDLTVGKSPDHSACAQTHSQTQEETQCKEPVSCNGRDLRHGEPELKRKAGATGEDLMIRTSKKVKISVGPAVDLGD